jgi:hypothetical protein
LRNDDELRERLEATIEALRAVWPVAASNRERSRAHAHGRPISGRARRRGKVEVKLQPDPKPVPVGPHNGTALRMASRSQR